MTLLILGVLAAGAVVAVDTTSPTSVPTLPTIPTTAPTTTSVPTTATTSPSTPRLALVAACVSDVTAIDEAVQAYEAVHGSLPPAGTAWAAGSLHWPQTGSAFHLHWSGTALVVTPAHGPAATGGAGSATLPVSGCYAI